MRELKCEECVNYDARMTVPCVLKVQCDNRSLWQPRVIQTCKNCGHFHVVDDKTTPNHGGYCDAIYPYTLNSPNNTSGYTIAKEHVSRLCCVDFHGGKSLYVPRVSSSTCARCGKDASKTWLTGEGINILLCAACYTYCDEVVTNKYHALSEVQDHETAAGYPWACDRSRMVINRKYGFVKEDYTEAIKYIMGNTNPKFIPDNTLPPQYPPLDTKKEVKEMKPTMECPNCKNTIEKNRGEKEVKFCPFCGYDIIGKPIGSAVEGYEYTIKRLECELIKVKQNNAELKRLHEDMKEEGVIENRPRRTGKTMEITLRQHILTLEHEAEQLHELVATCESRNEDMENQIAKLTQKGIPWKCRRCVRKYGQCSHHYSPEGKREQGPSCQVPAKPPRVKLSKEDKRKQRQCASRKECRKIAGKNCLAATCTCFKEKPVSLWRLRIQKRQLENQVRQIAKRQDKEHTIRNIQTEIKNHIEYIARDQKRS